MFSLGFWVGNLVYGPVKVVANMRGFSDVTFFCLLILWISNDILHSVIECFHHTQFMDEWAVTIEIQVLVRVGLLPIDRELQGPVWFSHSVGV